MEVSMMLRSLILALLLLGSAPAANAAEADGPYLFDLLKQPTYLAAWNGMLAGEQVPAWVGKYAKTFDGPSSPSKTVTVGGESYLLGWVCKAHDCGDNQLHVLFSPDGKRAWGLLLTGQQRSWLGKPDAAIQAAIQSGIE
jgi:hypothetical protein